MTHRWGTVVGVTAVLLGVMAGTAPATIHEHPVRCTYDAATKTLRLRLRPGYIAGFGVEEGGRRFEYYDHSDNNGYCGAATRFNTDRVVIVGPGDTPTGGIMTHGALRAAPGATPESSGLSEIEIHLRNVRTLRSYTAGTDDDIQLGLDGITTTPTTMPTTMPTSWG